MRFIGTAFEFRMILNAYKKVVIRQFNRFHQLTVRRDTGKRQTVGRKLVAVVIIELIAVTVAFLNLNGTVAFFHL